MASEAKKPKKPKKAKKTRTRRKQPQKAGVIQNVKINIGGSGGGVAGIPQYKINEATRNMLVPSGQAPPPPQEVIIRHPQPQQAPLTSAFSQNNMSQQAQQPLGSVNSSMSQQSQQSLGSVNSSMSQPSQQSLGSVNSSISSSFATQPDSVNSSISSSFATQPDSVNSSMSQQSQQSLGSVNGSIGQQSISSSFATPQPSAQERASQAAQERASQAAQDNYVGFNESVDGSIPINSFGSSLQGDDISVLSDASERGFLEDESITVDTDFSRPSVFPRASASQKTYNVQQPLDEPYDEQISLASNITDEGQLYEKFMKAAGEYNKQVEMENEKQQEEEAQLNAQFAAGAQVGEMQPAAAESSPPEPAEEPEEPDELVIVPGKKKIINKGKTLTIDGAEILKSDIYTKITGNVYNSNNSLKELRRDRNMINAYWGNAKYRDFAMQGKELPAIPANENADKIWTLSKHVYSKINAP